MYIYLCIFIKYIAPPPLLVKESKWIEGRNEGSEEEEEEMEEMEDGDEGSSKKPT